MNIKRLVWNAKKLFHIKSHGESDMSPTYVIRRVRELCDGLVTVTGDDALSVEAQANATLLFKILVIFFFAVTRDFPGVHAGLFRLLGGIGSRSVPSCPRRARMIHGEQGGLLHRCMLLIGVCCQKYVEYVIRRPPEMHHRCYCCCAFRAT